MVHTGTWRLRCPGLTDAEIVEVVAHVALSVFTNYLNNVSGTDIDFPEVPLSAAALDHERHSDTPVHPR